VILGEDLMTFDLAKRTVAWGDAVLGLGRGWGRDRQSQTGP
jgi:hypothetical protein